jgi:hypothetical protein
MVMSNAKHRIAKERKPQRNVPSMLIRIGTLDTAMPTTSLLKPKWKSLPVQGGIGFKEEDLGWLKSDGLGSQGATAKADDEAGMVIRFYSLPANFL